MTPFAIPNANCYTTTDVNLANTAQNFAFGPTHTAADQNQTYFRTTTVGVWAVRLETAPTPVPEPPTLMLILAGIVGLAACRARALRPGGVKNRAERARLNADLSRDWEASRRKALAATRYALGSASCLGQSHFELNIAVRNLRAQLATLALVQTNQAVALHRLECAR